MIKWFLINIFFLSISYTEIIYETGSLSEFFSGIEPNSKYDNWVSHVTEGIAIDGFNDYGPDWLDIQNNGFGTYKHLESDSHILDYWEYVFLHFVNGDTTFVDSLLQDSISSFFYELVIFQDTTYDETYHMLREQLDTSIVDYNQLDNEDDDVVGAFRNSWGLYIINPESNREQVIVQVPHPCDDFIAPYVAIEIFLQTNAYAFMINGAGREVLWTEEDNYSNNKSLSDPSRYPHTIFQKFHEAVAHPLIGSVAHSPLVLAIHSFDNESHLPRKSVIMAAGSNNQFTNKPIRDISLDYMDIVNLTEEFPIEENQFDNQMPLHVTDYYEAFYDDDFNYYNGDSLFSITLATELRGPANGVQMVDLQSRVNGYSVYEPWIHIELDEKPMLFDNIGVSNDALYSNGTYPTGINNFSIIREYYQPFISALEQYLSNWESIPDQNEPDSINFFSASNLDNPNEIFVRWSPIHDTNFKTYQIQADLDSTFNSPIIYDSEQYPELANMRHKEQILSGINNTQEWWFRIRGLDYFDNIGPWSTSKTNQLPGHSPPDTLLHFNTQPLIESIDEEDIDQYDFAIDSNNTFPGNNNSFVLFGNTWKSIDIEPFQIDTSTVLQVFSRVDSISEIQAIGFSDGETSIRYSFSGNESLDIEKWIPVYQGVNEVGNWFSYRLPLGNDWLAWYDSLTYINNIEFINDHDDTTSSIGSIHFSMVRDITSDLPIKPLIGIDYEFGDVRNENHSEVVSVSFVSTVQDTDSFDFTYFWNFGDGETSNEANPQHNYTVEDDHNYTVLLTVEDESGQIAFATTTIQVDPGSSTFPITMNFVGDIMMGRRFENEGGIIFNHGVEYLFEPTRELLGQSADLTIANLEIPLTDQGYAHPSKGIVFRCSPSNVNGLTYAGIDVVSLANNHILDYMEPGLMQTQQVLSDAGIIYSGSGLNSNEAYLPAIKSIKGQTIAFLASSDRTGQYNNYQPYLNAGENKSGFAYLTPYYLKQQIESVRDIVDIIVVEMHSGSEYSLSPGSDYDSPTLPDEFQSLRINPASRFGYVTLPEEGLDIEDYSHRLDRPKMWDRAIRHFAIDQGADLVIAHHPHIIQGLELYQGKLIAHSLGNFIFDLNYPETYPSIILQAKANEFGYVEFFVDPIYIDDYLTVPATGELGNYILDYVAMRSKELETYLHVDKDNNRAYVIMDTINMLEQTIYYTASTSNSKSILLGGESYQQSEPIPISKAGSISKITNENGQIIFYRLGREKIWMKNFENEGSSLWNLNNSNEILQDSIFRRGSSALLHLRNQNSPSNIVTNLEERLPFNNLLNHSLHGFIRTNNARNVILEARYADGRTNEIIHTSSSGDTISGNTTWEKYWGDIPNIDNATFIDVRANSGIPDSGIAFSWFDDVGLIEWDSLKTLTEYSHHISSPNNYDYIQLYFPHQLDTMKIELENTIFGSFDQLIANPIAVRPIITVPDYFHFFDESKGPIGNRKWKINSNIFSYGKTPSLFCEEPGIYEISLTIQGLGMEEHTSTISVIALTNDSIPLMNGDVNGDGYITTLDVLLSGNYILGIVEFLPQEFLAADMDNNLVINIFDLLLISNQIN